MFEGSTASGAERAYRRAVDKLTEFLVAEGAIHAVRLKQKSKTKRKKKIAVLICHIEWLLIADATDNFQIFFRKGKVAVVVSWIGGYNGWFK